MKKLRIMSLLYKADCAEQTSLQNALLDESCFITEYLQHELEGKIDFGCTRLNFLGTDKEPLSIIRKYDGVWEMEVLFDRKYFSMKIDEKIKYLFFVISNALKRYCEIQNIDFTLIEGVLNQFQQQGYKSDFQVLKKQCKRGLITAKLHLVQDIQKASFYLDLYKERDFIKRIPFFQTGTNVFHYYWYLGKLEWIDDSVICLTPTTIDQKKIFLDVNKEDDSFSYVRMGPCHLRHLCNSSLRELAVHYLNQNTENFSEEQWNWYGLLGQEKDEILEKYNLTNDKDEYICPYSKVKISFDARGPDLSDQKIIVDLEKKDHASFKVTGFNLVTQ